MAHLIKFNFKIKKFFFFTVFTAIIKHDIEFFDVNRTGELTSRLSSDTQVLQNAVTVNISSLARYAIQIVGSVILMFTLEPSLTGFYNKFNIN